MDWITETIAIGNYLDAEDGELLRLSGIRSIICLNDRLRRVLPQTLELDALQNYNLKDGPGNDVAIFQRAVDRSDSLPPGIPSFSCSVMQAVVARWSWWQLISCALTVGVPPKRSLSLP